MGNRVVPLRPAGSPRQRAAQKAETVTAVCLRPQCRAEFQRKLSRGRRQDYCSPNCRQLADGERRRAQAKLKHYEQNARLLRTDVAALNTNSSGLETYGAVHEGSPPKCADLQLARAIGRAEAILSLHDQIPDAKDALAAELSALVQVVQEHLGSQ
ncbi:hypothetical protein H7K14_04805 [Mycolicibacter longobardus]|uniref:hypothetical protein n=1 Tax=Mycolicibacter longobardus TaxID=1108812 RepID=UPI0021F3C6A1|nr:hypothetical protein [Mycolicibacter longobardus]MCV7383146.1 hypothetical protein [Mycolicibacter longobardus]